MYLFNSDTFVYKLPKMKSLMTPIITFLFLFVSVLSYGQDKADLDFKSIFPKGEKGIEYVKIMDVDSVQKNEIILRIKEWAISNINSQKAALQSEDLGSGYLLYQLTNTNTYQIPKGWGFSFIGSKIYTVTYETKFSINFYIKDNKFKVVVNNITNRAVSANGLWYEVITSSVGDKVIDEPAIPVENAGDNSINEYNDHPNEDKYIVRLNYSAKLWRNLDKTIRSLIENINTSVASKKKSQFDF